MTELHEHQYETARLSKEKASLQGTSESFRTQLQAIESKTQHLLEEKAAFENQWVTMEQAAWLPLLGLVPCYVVKSLQLIWRSGTRR